MIKDKLKLFVFLFVIIVNINFIMAAASFAVSSFSCTPSEVAINDVFSCTAQISNVGDASGSVSTATLYPDSGNWLENSNYPQSSGTSVSAGQSTEVTFSGLRAVKSGSNGFTKIMLDSVTDTYVTDNNVKENVINVAVTTTNSVSSAVMGGTFTSSSEVIAGGDIDVVLTFTSTSGGCSIGNQGTTKSISGMQDGNKQSRTWTVTQGTSGNCQYTITASATGSGGVATKTDTTSNSITCTDCPVASSSSSSSSAGGGGGGGGTAKTTASLGELVGSQTKEIGNNEKITFTIGSEQHSLLLINLSNTYATINVQSSIQTFILGVGDEIKVTLNNDQISIKLQSINTITKKAVFVLTRLTTNAGTGTNQEGNAVSETGEDSGEENTGKGIGEILSSEIGKWIIYGIISLVVIILIIIFVRNYQKRKKLGGY